MIILLLIALSIIRVKIVPSIEYLILSTELAYNYLTAKTYLYLSLSK